LTQRESAYASQKAEDAAFRQKVERNEALLNADPEKYLSKVVQMAWFGFFLYLCVLFLVTALAGGSFYLWLVLGVRMPIYLLLGAVFLVFSMWWTLLRAGSAKSSGYVVSRIEAPELYRVVDDIAAKLNAPRVDRILIDPELNASAAQIPRLGIFGWYRNDLTIGLPLLALFSRAEVEGIIGHELGHFSGNHSKKIVFIYRSMMMFAAVAEKFEGSWQVVFVLPILKRFIPTFSALAFPLMRKHEYEADAAEVKIAGKDVFVRSMLRLPVMGQLFYAEHLGAKLDQAASGIKTDMRIYGSLGKTSLVRDPSIPYEALSKALASQTDYADTHPSTTDRLKFNAYVPSFETEDALATYANELAIAPSPSAGDELCPELAQMLGERFDLLIGGVQAVAASPKSDGLPPKVDAPLLTGEAGVLAGLKQIRYSATKAEAIEAYRAALNDLADPYSLIQFANDVRALDLSLAEQAAKRVLGDTVFDYAAKGQLLSIYEERKEEALPAPLFDELNRYIEACKGQLISFAAGGQFPGEGPIAFSLSPETLRVLREAIALFPKIQRVHVACVQYSAKKTGSALVLVMFIDATKNPSAFKLDLSSASDIVAAIEPPFPIFPLGLDDQSAKIRKRLDHPNIIKIYEKTQS
jgi:Zn-dependent protease with chaperone function